MTPICQVVVRIREGGGYRGVTPRFQFVSSTKIWHLYPKKGTKKKEEREKEDGKGEGRARKEKLKERGKGKMKDRRKRNK